MEAGLHLKSYHSGIGHGWMFQQLRFQLCGSDLVALDFDELLERYQTESIACVRIGSTFFRSTT